MAEERTETSSNQYSGKGWALVRIRNLPEWITAPLTVIFGFVLVALFSVGVSLIYKLVERVWSGTADTVPAASAALTAIAAVFGAVFLTWRTVVAHWQARASQEQASVARESHYTTLFTKAVEQLGTTREVVETSTIIGSSSGPVPRIENKTRTEPNIEVRLGAIYALERIAHDSERDHWPIMEVLCAYVRKNAGDGESIPEHFDFNEDNEELEAEIIANDERAAISDRLKSIRGWVANLDFPRSDIQAALTVIGRRSEGRRAWEAQRAGDPSSPGDYRLDFRNANLQKADIQGLFFERANFRGAKLDGALVRRCHLADAILNAAQIANANFEHADITLASFASAKLYGTGFRKCLADKTRFAFARMYGGSFSEASLTEVDFSHSVFSATRMFSANIFNCSFNYCNLSLASFIQATIHESSFKKAQLQFARLDLATLYGSDFAESLGLTDGQLHSAFEGDGSTLLPSTVVTPKDWPREKLTELQIADRLKAREEKSKDEIPF